MSIIRKDRLDLLELEPRSAVSGTACLRSKIRATIKQGKPYLKIELSNHTGTIGAASWSEGMPAWEELDVGAPLQVEGTVKIGWNHGPPELVVTNVRSLARPHDVELELNALARSVIARAAWTPLRPRGEPRRDSRRLLTVRSWSHDKVITTAVQS